MAGPIIILSSDEEDEDGVQDQQTFKIITENGKKVTVLDSPNPELRNNALEPEPILPPIPRRARQSLPLQSKASSARSPPSQKLHHGRTAFNNTALSPPAKISPPSASGNRLPNRIDTIAPSSSESPGKSRRSDILRKVTKSTRENEFQAMVEAGQRSARLAPLSSVGRPQRISSSHRLMVEHAEEEDDNDIIRLSPRTAVENGKEVDEEGEEANPEELETPSKGPFGVDRNSQKSFDQSFGTDSPIAIRSRERKSRRDTEKGRIQRDESPRDVMAQRSISTDQQSNGQQLDIDKLEEDLIQFRQRVHDDHAETVKWLLHDAKRASDGRKSAFMDKVSPFASMTTVKASPALSPNGMTTLKLDSYVSSCCD